MTKPQKRLAIIYIIVLAIAAIALAVSMSKSTEIEKKLGLLYYVEKTTPAPDDGSNGSDGDTGKAGVVQSSGLYIYYLDVGQGDCTIVRFPDDKTMIIDAGKGNSSVKTAITTFIDNTFGTEFEYFDYAILTHPDEDHCGSMSYVLQKYPARVCYRPNVQATSGGYTDPAGSLPKEKNTVAYRTAIEAMYAQTDGITPTVYVTNPESSEQTIVAEDNSYTFAFFSPLSQSYADWNDYSPIMIVSYNGFYFALSGDAEKTNESEFAAKVAAAKTDGVTDKYDMFTDTFTVNAIKCGHHGSGTSTSSAYIEAITTPSGAESAYYIISCGKDNSYGHPHAVTLNRLKSLGVPDSNILRTDILGNVTLSVRADSAGKYGLYYGDAVAKPPAKMITTRTLDYKEAGGVQLKWGIVAWTAYAALVVVAIVHIVVFGSNHGDAVSRKGRRRK